jgi:hypothetical protein
VDELKDGTALSELELYCNRDFKFLEALLADMVEIILVISEALQRTVALASCDTIVPIYTAVAYDAGCNYSLTAVMWVFTGFLITSFFGFLMITLRSSFNQTRYVTAEQEAWGKDVGPNIVQPGESVIQEVQPEVQVRNSKRTVEDYGLDSPSSRDSGVGGPTIPAVPF